MPLPLTTQGVKGDFSDLQPAPQTMTFSSTAPAACPSPSGAVERARDLPEGPDGSDEDRR